MPARHPADRDVPVPSTTAIDPNTPTNPTETPNPRIASPTAPADDSSSAHSTNKSKRILGFLTVKKIPAYGGLRLTTLLAFIVQFLFFAGTVAAWVLSIQQINRVSKKSSNTGSSSAIFVHVVFGIAVLGQLLFLERRLFCLRAERYSFLHPGEILPRSRSRSPGGAALAFSPWNRPPLPTYAAALADSGVGTGDVEDHIIAAPPPPAYGNTRGSTLLLAGFLRDSLRAQRPSSRASRVSRVSQTSRVNEMDQRPDRPVSYASHDEQWEEYCDAERARRLEETLTTLERPTSRLSQQARS